MIIAMVLLASCFATPTARAQAAAEEPASEASSEKEPAFREQTIYIPYEKLRKVFEREGRGVFLPYEQFQALWKAAREKPDPQRPDDSPEAVLLETRNRATIRGGVMHVEAEITIDVLKRGWHRVPLRLTQSAVTGATIDGASARLVQTPGSGYELLYHHESDEPATIRLNLRYARSIDRSGGRHRVQFHAPQAPVSRWELTIPEAGVKVDIEPLIAASEAPTDEADDAQTRVLAFVGAAPIVSIAWTPKAEGASGLEALVSVQTRQEYHIGEAVHRLTAAMTYDIQRAALDRLRIDVPNQFKVADVANEHVRRWSVAASPDDADRQRITIELFQPVRGEHLITVRLERYVSDDEDSPVAAPLIEAVEVVRQQGVLLVRSAGSLRAEVAQTRGLVQVDRSDADNGGQWQFAYRYPTTPYHLALNIEKLTPRIETDALIKAQITPTRLYLDTYVQFEITNVGVFELAMDIPDGFMVHQVHGAGLEGGASLNVESHRIDKVDGPTDRLVLALRNRAIGKQGLRVHISRPLGEPDLQSPTGKVVTVEIPEVRAAGDHVEEQRGRLLVLAPEALRIRATNTQGLRTVDTREAAANMRGAVGEAQVREAVLAYTFANQPYVLTIEAERRQPRVVVGQLLTARVEPGVVKYRADFHYDVQYSGVRSLRIDLPADVAAEARNTTENLRETVIAPAPGDLAEGCVAWQITGRGELLGSFVLSLTWERRLETLEVGKSVTIEIPRLQPRGVDRAWGQVVLAKAETIDLQAVGELTGIRPIDPRHDLMNSQTVAGAAEAVEFHTPDWSLMIEATHYELAQIKRSSIEQALVRAAVSPSDAGDELSAQAIYRIRSVRQRLRLTLPEKVQFDSQPLRLNGEPAALERGKPGEFFVPLVGVSPDEPFILELRYTLPDAASRIDLPRLPDDPATQQVYLSVHLPTHRKLLGTTGPWRPRMDWRLTASLHWQPHPVISEEQLIREVTQGRQGAINAASSFRTDGTQVLVSTLRPPPPPDGSLGIVSMHAGWFRALVIAVIALLGGLLIRRPVTTKLAGVGGVICVVILLGVFTPTLARQLLSGLTVAAVMVVVIAWGVHYLIRVRPHDPVVQARREARQQRKLERIQRRRSPASPPDAPSSDTASGTGDTSDPTPPADDASDHDDEEGGRRDA